MFDALKFFQDYNIPTADKGSQHFRIGWANTHCPFCKGPSDYHLGINVQKGYGTCYRCGWNSLNRIIEKLLPCTEPEAKEIIRQYTGTGRMRHAQPESQEQQKTTVEHVVFPAGTSTLTAKHKSYLESRNFDSDKLEREYKLLGTGPVGDYKHKIIIPIYFGGRLVSYQGRDITGKLEKDRKYKACRLRDEVMHHKDILYGIDHAQKDAVVVVEGVFDVWRLGAGAVATFGTSYKTTQVRMLAERFNRVFVLFDSEENAQQRAKNLAYQIAATGKQVERVSLAKGDPGSMGQDDANHLMKELLKA